MSGKFIIGIISIFALFWYLGSYIFETRNCYDSHSLKLEEVIARTKLYAWDKRKICIEQADVLITLGQCFGQTDNKYQIRYVEPLRSILNILISFTRTAQKDYPSMVKTYNEECRLYTETL